MMKWFVSCTGIMVIMLLPLTVLSVEADLLDYFWPLEPGLVLHYESDGLDYPKGARKLHHTIRISEIRKAPGSGDVTVKTEEEFSGLGQQFMERFEYVLSTQKSELRRIASDENRTMLRGPLIVGASWPVVYQTGGDFEGKLIPERKVNATCSITDIKTEERLNKSTTCLWVACPVKFGRASFIDNFCFCKGFGYFGTLVEEPNGKTFWQDRLISVIHPEGYRDK